jgi:hypothetical protein
VCDEPAATETERQATSSRRRLVVDRFVVDGVETVAMTDEHYEQAVNALVTLIVGWAADLEQSSARPGQADSD